MGDTRPNNIKGECVFTSYDGLRAEGNGILGFLTFDQNLVEMRGNIFLEALPAYTSDDHCMFVQMITIEQEDYWIFGVVQKIQDYNKRSGIIGSCVCTHLTKYDYDSTNHYLYDVLQANVVNKFANTWKGRPLPKQLGIIENVPNFEKKTFYKTKKYFETVWTNDVDPKTAIDTVMLQVEYNQDIGKVLMFNTPTSGARAIDSTYIEAANELANKIKRSNEEQICRTQNQQFHTHVQAQKEFNAQGRNGSNEGMIYSSDTNNPTTLEGLIDDVQQLRSRVTALEELLKSKKIANILRGNTELPIDKVMRFKKNKTLKNVNKIILISGMVLVGLLVFFMMISLFLPFTSPAPVSAPYPVDETSTISKKVTDSEGAQEWKDCSQSKFENVSKQTECENKRGDRE